MSKNKPEVIVNEFGKHKNDNRVLELLKSRGEEGIFNHELLAFSMHHTGFISRLRASGYKIETINCGSGEYKYILKSEPKGEVKKQQKAIDMFWEMLNNFNDEEITKELLDTMFKDYGFNIVRKWGYNH